MNSFTNSHDAPGLVTPESDADERPRSVAGRLLAALPTLLVLLGLGALAYAGHRSGWTVRRPAWLKAESDARRAAWCVAHDVPESVCIECRPEILPRGDDFGFCRTHGVHQCVLCHPELAQLDAGAELSPADLERATRGLELLQRAENNSLCQLYRRRVQFASADDVERAGVDVQVAVRRKMTESIRASGEIGYDQTRLAHLAPRAAGAVWRVTTRLGERVEEGQVLAVVDAAEVGRAKADFLQARVQLDLKKQVVARLQSGGEAFARRQLREAEAELSAARIRLLSAQQALANLGLPIQPAELEGMDEEAVARRLQFLGLPELMTEGLSPETTTANLLPLRAPFAGEVVDFEVVAGEVVDPTKTLFVVADRQRMWLTLHVSQENVRHAALGQEVRFLADGSSADARGEVVWIGTEVDEKTRTVAVRAVLDNPGGRLRANMFGTGRLVLREEPDAIVVPNDAVHWDGSCHVVFVRDKHYFEPDAPKVFHTRTVRPAAKDEQYTELLAGVLPGEVVASRGSGVLRSALLKNNLGAG